MTNLVPRILGVDPGASGAIALLCRGELIVKDMPSVPKLGILDSQLALLIRQLSPTIAWIERVHAMPKQGVASSFNFGLAYGIVRGIVGTLHIPMLFVAPTEWKKEFRLTSDKGQSRALASRLYPQNAKDFMRAKDDGRAEAALIATYGSRYPL